MQLISVGNVILNLDRISALNIEREKEDVFVLRILADSPEPVISLSLAPEVPDLLLSLVPRKCASLDSSQRSAKILRRSLLH
jgi:hypothetical protein